MNNRLEHLQKEALATNFMRYEGIITHHVNFELYEGNIGRNIDLKNQQVFIKLFYMPLKFLIKLQKLLPQRRSYFLVTHLFVTAILVGFKLLTET